jgi:hypothetical protein
MSKPKEIWEIVKRKDFKDGDEVHAVKFNNGLLLSNKLYESLKPELDAMPENKTHYSDLYGLRIISTPHLPYIYRKVKAKPIEGSNK